MKNYNIYLDIKPLIITISFDQIRVASMSYETSTVLAGDDTLEEKQKKIRAIREKYQRMSDSNISKLSVIKKSYSLMRSFYVFNKKEKYAISDGIVTPTFLQEDYTGLIDLSFFWGFSDKISREVMVDGINMEAICNIENQFIVCRNGIYGVVVDDGETEIEFGKKIDSDKMEDDIRRSLLGLVKTEKNKRLELKRNIFKKDIN